MAVIAPTMTLAELALERPAAVDLLERLQLDYCCGGQRTLREACSQRGLDPVTVIATIEALGDRGEPELDAHDVRRASIGGSATTSSARTTTGPGRRCPESPNCSTALCACTAASMASCRICGVSSADCGKAPTTIWRSRKRWSFPRVARSRQAARRPRSTTPCWPCARTRMSLPARRYPRCASFPAGTTPRGRCAAHIERCWKRSTASARPSPARA